MVIPPPTEFHGSYLPEDVQFLLKQVALAPTDVETKERLIQSGRAHYSTMLSAEHPPEASYLELFHEALERNGDRFARDVAALARTLAAQAGGEIVLASLARAGTPVGVLLVRALRALGLKSTHYSLSIIRDRGIDTAALDHILARHNAADVVFLDGWTGKGSIARELEASIAEYNAARGTALAPRLAVVVDLAGVAEIAVTAEDYLIPSSILNAVVSGLVSRTLLNEELVLPGDFHACVYYAHLAPHDLSRHFVDVLSPKVAAHLAAAGAVAWSLEKRAELSATSDAFIARVGEEFGVRDRHRIKPGIGESTRALLRRVPDCLLIADPAAQDLLHLGLLAKQKQVPIHHVPDLPYRATAIIREVREDG
jgi:hypothetical protein